MKMIGDKTLVTITGSWAYTFSIEDDRIRHLSSARPGYASAEVVRIRVKNETLTIRALPKLTDNVIEVLNAPFDSTATTVALNDAPSSLLHDWEMKCALTINNKGEIVSLYQAEARKPVADEVVEDEAQETRPPAPPG